MNESQIVQHRITTERYPGDETRTVRYAAIGQNAACVLVVMVYPFPGQPKGRRFKVLPYEIDMHTRSPQFEGHEPSKKPCTFLGCICYCDGSLLGSKGMWALLQEKGLRGLWADMDTAVERWQGEYKKVSESPKAGPKKRRPAQRVDLDASSGPAPWLDDSALVKSLREQLAARDAEVVRLRASNERLTWGYGQGGGRACYHCRAPYPSPHEPGCIAADPGQGAERVRLLEAVCKAAKALCHRWPEDVVDGVDSEEWEALTDMAHGLRDALATPDRGQNPLHDDATGTPAPEVE